MAGHNKWSKIKRQKKADDRKKSKVWARCSREISVAAREGGGDPEMNAALANAIARAETENMPKDTIERAVKRGTGDLEGENYEPATYEGYAPHGVAVFVVAMTNNNNRTVADLRHLFDKHGGSLGKNGSVAYLFDRKGRIELPADGQDELALFEVVVEAGAEDLRQEDGYFIVMTPVERFDDVQRALEHAGIEPEEADLVRVPTTTVTLDDGQAQSVLNLIDAMEELDDVESVYTSLEMDGEPVQAT